MRVEVVVHGAAAAAPPPPPPRPPGVFAFVLHDYQSSEYFRQDWNYSVPRGLFYDQNGVLWISEAGTGGDLVGPEADTR